jgi:hypothetical protein
VVDSGLAAGELGIFARTYKRSTLDEVLDAALADGFRALHFNFTCAGLAALPEALDEATCRRIRPQMLAAECVEHIAMTKEPERIPSRTTSLETRAMHRIRVSIATPER